MFEGNLIILQQPRLDSPERSTDRRTRPCPGHLKVCEIHRCAAESVTSVLPVVRRRRDAEALHLVKQRGALQAKSGSCSSRTAELPIGALASSENFATHLVFEGRV